MSVDNSVVFRKS